MLKYLLYNRRIRPLVYGEPLQMRVVRIRTLIQAVTLVALTMYTSFLVYRIISPSGDRQRDPNALGPWGDYEAFNALLPTAALKSLFVGVKTTASYHKKRLPVLVRTWFQLVRAHTWFFTDTDDPEFEEKTQGHLINTNCPASQGVRDLCCDLWVALEKFIRSGQGWFCHVHDDVYVNVPRLLGLLLERDPQDVWYLGKPLDLAPGTNSTGIAPKEVLSFATSGAGFCLSRALVLRMVPVAGMGKFARICKAMGTAYDVTLGYVIGNLLNTSLTVIDKFHSHLEPMKSIDLETFYEHITFSYSEDEVNIVDLDGFDLDMDPTRFLSIHCYLFPNFRFCPK